MSSGSLALLTPVFNGERFVERFRAQWEGLAEKFDQVILYDDGSADRGAAMLRDLGFRVIDGGENKGPGGARNMLARASDATWIHFHDIDDEIAPDYVTQVRTVLNDDVDVLFHDVVFLSEATREPEFAFSWHADVLSDPVRSLLTHPMPTPSSVIRREAFLRVDGFDEQARCFEDGDLHLRLAASGARVQAIRCTLETALRHGEGASRDMGYCHRCRLQMLERYLTELPARLQDDVREEFYVTGKNLLLSGDEKTAASALRRFRELGGEFPRTRSTALRALGHLLPDVVTLRAQLGFGRLVGRLRSHLGRGA